MNSDTTKRVFWTDGRTRRLSVAVLAALLLTVLVSALIRAPQHVLLTRGDFPAFYAAGTLAARGEWGKLYDPQVQAEIQNTFWPDLNGDYYYFAYPPFVARFFQPFSYFAPETAKLICVVLMLSCVAASAYMASRCVPGLEHRFFQCFAGFLAFTPLFIAVIAAQNSPVSMFLQTAAVCLAFKRRSDLVLGGVLGLLFFKPHFALPLLLLVLVARRWEAALGMCTTLFCLLLAVPVERLAFWPEEWLRAVFWFATEDMKANAYRMVSILSLFERAAPIMPFSAVVMRYISVLLVNLLFLLTVRIFAVYGSKDRSGVGLGPCLMLAFPTLILIAPHALFYDLSVCLLPFAWACRPTSDRDVTAVICGLASCALLFLLLDQVSLEPFIIFAAGAYFYVYRRIGQNAGKATALLPSR